MYDLYGIGNALVDMEYQIEDSFLRRHDIAKGHMTLVEGSRLESLSADLNEQSPTRMSGGSAANTIIAVQAFGAQTFYSCKVASDETGTFFLSDLGATGVATNPNAQSETGTSGCCLVLITPDAERSMNTCLGISSNLSESEIDESALANSRYFYVEGYLSSSAQSMAAAIACRELAESAHVETAVSLSDPSMVEFFREPLEKILGNGVDHLFCNEEEALAWSRTDRLDVAVAELRDIGKNLNITLGSKGCMVVGIHDKHFVQGYPAEAVDTTGAGDMFAGGCLYGRCAGMDAQQAAALGNFSAARLVQQLGARLRKSADYQTTLADFLNKN